MSQFSPYDKSTHNLRIQKIKERSKRGYMDDGPISIYHALKELQAKNFNDTLEWALSEIERLYQIEDNSKLEKKD